MGVVDVQLEVDEIGERPMGVVEFVLGRSIATLPGCEKELLVAQLRWQQLVGIGWPRQAG